MKNRLIASSIPLVVILQSSQAYAQIIPDTSFGEQSSQIKIRKNSKGHKNINVIGGKRIKSILFHSFKEFNIKPTISLTYLTNKNSQTIITRVTESPSILAGKLISPGQQNILFLNPNGIIFKNGFSLNIGGSFFPSTASRITWINGNYFSATDKKLNLNNKINNSFFLDFEKSSGKVLLYNDLINPTNESVFLPFIGFRPYPINLDNKEDGFNLNQGKSIIIAGNKIELYNSSINVNQGDINLISLESGKIKFNTDTFKVESINNTEFSNINLSESSQLNLRNAVDNFINLNGKNILLDTGSVISHHSGKANSDSSSESINIISKSLNIKRNPNKSALSKTINSSSLIYSFSNSGKGADININSSLVDIPEAGRIFTIARNNGKAGNLLIQSNRLEISGYSNNISEINANNNPGNGIFSASIDKGNTGDIRIFSPDIKLLDSGNIGIYNLDRSQSGEIKIYTSDLVVSGFSPVFPIPSQIQTGTASLFDAGNISIIADDIKVSSGSGIGSTSFGIADSGEISITADRLVLDGKIPNTINKSRIFSSVQEQEQEIRDFVGIDLLAGNAKNLTLNIDNILIKNEAEISVKNDGLGDAGNLIINSKRLNLRTGSQIIAATRSGDGGNIFINSDALSIVNASINSSSQGSGQGGNIDIATSFAAFFDNSVVEANSENALAGNIKFTTDSAFASPDTQFTTTSNLGPQFDGSIKSNVQNSQPIRTVRISPIQKINTNVSKICGFDGNRLSTTSNALVEEILDNPELISAWNILEKYNQTNGQYFRDMESGEIRPIRPVLAIEYLDNGNFRSIYDPKESKYVLDLLSSLEVKCNKLRVT